MACKRYEILLVDMQGQAKQTREWTDVQLLGSVAWLKRMNARGHNVLVRPIAKYGPTLLDRLTRVEVAKLERSGVPFSVKIQIEEDRFQIWLPLGSAAVAKKLRDEMAKSLELPRLETGKFGQLAGFVNYQTGARTNRDRFVLSHEAVKPGDDSIGKWERMLKEADKPVRAKGLGNWNSREKGFSR